MVFLALASVFLGFLALENRESTWSASVPDRVPGITRLSGILTIPKRFRWFVYIVFVLVGATLCSAVSSWDLSAFDAICLVFVSWCLISVVWAEDRPLTAVRSLEYSIVVALAFVIAQRFPSDSIILMVLVFTGSVPLLGLLEELFTGALGSGRVYRFSGTISPVKQGSYCGIFLLCTVSLYQSGVIGPWTLLALGIPGLTLMLLSRSLGSVASCFAGLAAWIVWSTTGGISSVAWSLSVVCLVLIATCLSSSVRRNAKQWLTAGRSTRGFWTLSGRTEIWRYALAGYRDRPVLGYGYGGFWNKSRGSEMQRRRNSRKQIYTSVSGLIDALVGGGIAGFVLLVAMLLTAAVAGWNHPESGLLFAVSVFILVNSTVESTIVVPRLSGFCLLLLVFALT